MVTQEMVQAVMLERQAELAALLQMQEAERLVRDGSRTDSTDAGRVRRRPFSLAGWLGARSRAQARA